MSGNGVVLKNIIRCCAVAAGVMVKQMFVLMPATASPLMYVTVTADFGV